MIRLDVEDYCQDCLDFEAKVEPCGQWFVGGKFGKTDTVIHCEKRERCRNIKKYLEGQVMQNESS